jgi:hypothetical protein
MRHMSPLPMRFDAALISWDQEMLKRCPTAVATMMRGMVRGSMIGKKHFWRHLAGQQPGFACEQAHRMPEAFCQIVLRFIGLQHPHEPFR